VTFFALQQYMLLMLMLLLRWRFFTASLCTDDTFDLRAR